MSSPRFKRILSGILLALAFIAPAAAAPPIKILAFGTSLTQGYGLPPGTEFTVVMQQQLKAKRHRCHARQRGRLG